MTARTRLNVVGWRHLTQSFAVVNQWQLLSLMKRDDVELSLTEAPLFKSHWRPRPGLFSPEQTQALSSLQMPSGAVDVEYRITFPFDFSGAKDDRLVLSFGVTEGGTFAPSSLRQGTSLGDLNAAGGAQLVTPSRWSRDRFVERGVDEHRIHVVPHGVDQQTFRPDATLRAMFRKKLNLGGFVFLNVGAMSGNKGIGLLLEAFGALLEGGGQATLVLKGNDALYTSQTFVQRKLEMMSERRRGLVLDNLVYIGAPFDMAAMAGLYNAADAYVSPYLSEGFNMPVLEAAGVGLPIICTAGGPTDDFTTDAFRRNIESTFSITDGGIRMVRPKLEHLTQLMCELVDDEAFVLGARTDGPRHVAAGYTWDVVVAQLVGLMRRA